jgi:hypothetical protein
MKRTYIIAGLFPLAVAIQWLLSCADPLQQIGQSPLSPPGSHTDTIYSFDTLVVFDTIVHIDTVVISESDHCQPSRHCSTIGAGHHKIVWLLRNSEGRFRLDFAALAERNKPVQTVIVEIDGQKFEWSPAKNEEFSTEMHLGQNAIVRIISDQPCAFGHAIDICLTVTKL